MKVVATDFSFHAAVGGIKEGWRLQTANMLAAGVPLMGVPTG